ncbi:MAG TPA: DUF2332 family protein [Azospirillaceae bacterium]|nr:DUF2332 family protein [Azospirillaceae bacterium]
MPAAPARPDVLAAFATQVRWCDELGSPFTARLLERAGLALAAGQAPADLLGDWPGDPKADALALRFAGALHALVLSGSAPALAACYPPHAADIEALWAAVGDALAAHPEHMRAWLASPPQTNEARRSAVLLGGFLEVAHLTGRPLRLLEIGASAGLNLMGDRFRYRLTDTLFGDIGSSVEVATDWLGPSPRMDAPLRVVSRQGCDIRPIDLEDAEQRLRLRAYVWADQSERMAMLAGAMDLARAAGVRVNRADAADWVDARLAEETDAATVLYHSLVWQYLPAATQARITAAMEEAGARATKERPLAWLSFELQAEGPAALTLRLWDGGAHQGTERLLAHAHGHGAWVEWRVFF